MNGQAMRLKKIWDLRQTISRPVTAPSTSPPMVYAPVRSRESEARTRARICGQGSTGRCRHKCPRGEFRLLPILGVFGLQYDRRRALQRRGRRFERLLDVCERASEGRRRISEGHDGRASRALVTQDMLRRGTSGVEDTQDDIAF
jgi:hypothetical protein